MGELAKTVQIRNFANKNLHVPLKLITLIRYSDFFTPITSSSNCFYETWGHLEFRPSGLDLAQMHFDPNGKILR
jgi:hypothetical protein